MVRITAAEAKKQLSRLLTQVGDSHEPVHITGKDNGAVL
ncbi:MAG: type II toxin-antitoxin system Phd/YefM family antitoxin, partial [Phycisphaerae bacterium]|nr:type II toxin-antitoxin system Phd/YefM family antitoxin [Phycisphaerae bacterium]